MPNSEIIINHDGIFDIAEGRNRKELSWKNREWAWSDLVKKVSVTHRTAESYSEYCAAKKPRQDEIKDIGGFVGGYLNNGRRKSGNVVHRQLVTLDIDFATAGFWDDFLLVFGNAAAMYSTHKHSSETPRLRLIIPLDRPVAVDEYIAISRRIAGDLDIELFDPTTFQPERLMYWPSTSKDGSFLFEYQDGPWLCANDSLKKYRNWQDSSEWPVSSKVDKIILRSIQKQGDPMEKGGIVGAFCRTYSIEEAIDTFLDEVYEPCTGASEGRYTYKSGSTAAGLVIYEDKYAYSHHGTDPVSGKLCNAFDLVRLHKFGLKDEDAREGTPGNKLPSYQAMLDFATKDASVRKTLGAEKLSEAKDDFTDIDITPEDEAPNDDWLAELQVDRKGNYLSTINNIILILENDPKLKNRLALDTFENREIARRNLPWRKVTEATKYLTDADDNGLWHYLEKTYDINNVSKTEAALSQVLRNNSFHPVREYLNSLTWDGESRIETLLVDYLGAADTEYVRAVTRKKLVAAVSRVFQPGIKFDYVLVLVGDQGQGKSRIIDRLGKQWFSDSFTTVHGKEAFEQIQGVWIVEMAELAGLKNAEIETIKHFVSKRVDRYRVAYGRRVENFSRQCIFFGTSNNRGFLRDPTGNRRWWPVDTMEQEPTKDVFTDFTDSEINQVWAEAMALYKQGETLYLNKEEELLALQAQNEHVEQDERTGLILKYLDTKLPANWDELGLYERRAWLAGDELQAEGTVTRKRVCAAEIWCEVLGGQQKEMNRFNTKDIHNIMKGIPGWTLYKTKMRIKGYGLQNGYVRDENIVTSKVYSVTSKVIDDELL